MASSLVCAQSSAQSDSFEYCNFYLCENEALSRASLALATLALCDRVKGQSNRFDISIHVIDTGKGSGANEAPVKLYKSKSNDDWLLVSQGKTGASGRLTDFTSSTLKFTKGIYKFTVGAKDYYSAAGQETLFPVIDIIFNIDDTNQHYHIPLLLNAYGYSTYRGS